MSDSHPSADPAHPAATSHADGAASLAPLPHAGGVGGGNEPRKQRPPRHDEWTRAKMVAFLRELAASQSVSQAARAVGMGRQSAYKLRMRMAPFAAAWDAAVEESRLTGSPAPLMGRPLPCPLCGAVAGRQLARR